MNTLIAEIYFSKEAASLGDQPWFWRLRSGNRKIIATGNEGFKSAASARRAFNNVHDRLTRVPVVVRTISRP